MLRFLSLASGTGQARQAPAECRWPCHDNGTNSWILCLEIFGGLCSLGLMNNLMRSLLLLVLGLVWRTGFAFGQTEMSGIRTVKGFVDDRLCSVKTLDEKGRCTFLKEVVMGDVLQMEATEYDAVGKPRRRLVVTIRGGMVDLEEFRYTATKMEHWEPLRFMMPDATTMAANKACSVTGSPRNGTELRALASVKAALTLGNCYKSEVSELDAQGKVLRTTSYDKAGVADNWETMAYDPAGRLLSIQRRNAFYKTTFTEENQRYDSLGNEVLRYSLTVKTNGVDTISVGHSTYNGRQVLTIEDHFGGLAGHLTKRESYVYDAQGDLVRRNQFLDLGKVPSSYALFRYDAAHRLVEIRNCVDRNGEVVVRSVERWEYL